MNQREASRAEWRTHGVPPCRDEINSGSLQRIADATEAMAESWIQLRNRADYYERLARENYEMSERLRRSCASLRGVITKLKRELGR
jgi:hypothetical protein